MDGESGRVIITGANSGIGLAAAHRYAELGHHVIMACRSAERGRKAVEHVNSAAGSGPDAGKAELMLLDCSSGESIEAFAAEFHRRYDRLDILVNNAAYVNHGSPRVCNTDGVELTFATNVLAPFKLTELLSGPLSASPDARILNAGSNIVKHFFNPSLRVDLETVAGPVPPPAFSVYNRYRDSKMALLMLTFRMAERYEQRGIHVNSLQINGAKMSPETVRKFTAGYRFVARLQNLIFPPPEFMANAYVELTTSSRFKGVTGKLFNHRLEEMEPSPESPTLRDQLRQLFGAEYYPRIANDVPSIDRVWQRCAELTAEP